MKKTITLLLVLLVLLVPISTGLAQEPSPTLDSMLIDVWPDYDRPSALILISAMLPADTPLPATVTIPMPEGADLLVVARIDDADGVMKDDIAYSETDGAVTLTTPDREFRIEYYIPYEANGLDRSFDFTWTAPFDVNQAAFKLQRPSAATAFTFEPATASAFQENGLTYHQTPPQEVLAGQPFSINLNYTLSANRLSIEDLRNNITDAQTTFSEEAAPVVDAGSGINWPLIAVGIGGLLVIGALGYQFAANRGGGNRPYKPRPIRAARPSAPPSRGSKFCHNCGESVGSSDKFCANCGTAVKR